MNAQEYIASGQLELFVYGTLSEEENREVVAAMNKYPEVKQEVERIEVTLKELSEEVSPGIPTRIWNTILAAITADKDHKTITMNNWPAISGWAAAVVCLLGILWMFNKNNELQNRIVETNTEKEYLQEQVVSTDKDLQETNNLLEILRDRDLKVVRLPGNIPVAPAAYATVYYDKDAQTVHLDAKGLPDPPEGMVYQVWSLVMEPLTPTSIGLLDDFVADTNKIFTLQNIPDGGAFGITLEPAGGSETPTLSRLYALGTI